MPAPAGVLPPVTETEFRQRFPASVYPEFRNTDLNAAILQELVTAQQWIDRHYAILDVAVYESCVYFLAAHLVAQQSDASSRTRSQTPTAVTVAASGPARAEDQDPLSLGGTIFGRRFRSLVHGYRFIPGDLSISGLGTVV